MRNIWDELYGICVVFIIFLVILITGRAYFDKEAKIYIFWGLITIIHHNEFIKANYLSIVKVLQYRSFDVHVYGAIQSA